MTTNDKLYTDNALDITRGWSLNDDSISSGLSCDTITVSDTSMWDSIMNGGTITTSGLTGGYTIGDRSISSKIQLSGEGADIEINGVSLVSRIDTIDRSLQAIESRLNVLRPNEKLESEWNELAELGRRYRELEADILEQTRLWTILKS